MCPTRFLCRVLVGGLGYLAAVHGADVWTTEVHAFALFCDHCLVYNRGQSIINAPNRYMFLLSFFFKAHTAKETYQPWG